MVNFELAEGRKIYLMFAVICYLKRNIKSQDTFKYIQYMLCFYSALSPAINYINRMHSTKLRTCQAACCVLSSVLSTAVYCAP